eukprot:7904597-Alexandrium_andersonii.AAC.1
MLGGGVREVGGRNSVRSISPRPPQRGGSRPPRTSPTGASGAGGLTGGATAPRDPPTGASGAPEAPVWAVRGGGSPR